MQIEGHNEYKRIFHISDSLKFALFFNWSSSLFPKNFIPRTAANEMNMAKIVTE